MADLSGTTLGSYDLLEKVGEGGFAAVYRAFHPATDREVAVKVLAEMNSHAVERFKREAAVIARLQHIHILPIFDYGEQQGMFYLVMRYVPTGTLRDYLRVHHPLPLAEALRLFLQVADAVHFAHQQGVLHRDLKPVNVLLDESRHALLSDFGLARTTNLRSSLTGDNMLGTPLYIAPEQAQGTGVDARSDVYALGIMLYELLVGDVPFHAPTAVGVILKHINTLPLPPRTHRPEIPESVEQTILRALAKAPDQRFQSVAEMSQALQGAITPQEIRITPPPSNTGLLITSRLVNVPPLPANLVERQEELTALKKAITGQVGRRVALTAVHGMGGIGKTVLALGLCHDRAIQDFFAEGIFWVNVGRDAANLVGQLREIGKFFGDSPEAYDSLEASVMRLKNLLHERAILLVLDDVWEARYVEIFQLEGVRVLFTTRDSHIALALGAEELRLGVLSPDQATAMLREWAGRADPHLATIAERLGYLPLALKLAGARLREGLSGEEWLQTFQHVAQMKLGRRSKDPQENLEVCFDLSLEQLDPADRQLYFVLGIFPEELAIPQAVITKLWQQMDGSLTAFDCEEIIRELSRLALVDRQQKTAHLHDLLLDYARSKLGADWQKAHQTLLQAYGGGAWSSVMDDGYLYDHLAYHLMEAGQAEELRTLLLDYEWMMARLILTTVVGLISDYEYLKNDPALALVQGALRLCAHILAQDMEQLAPQLLGSLLRFQAPEIQALLAQIQTVKQGIWLRPLAASLIAPGGALLRTLMAHRDTITGLVMTEGRVVSAAYDHTIKIWDMERGVEVMTLLGHEAPVSALALTPDGQWILSGSHDRTLRLWDAHTGKEEAVLSGHKGWILGLAVTPDGRYAVSGSVDNTLKLWDLHSRREIITLRGHTAQVTGVIITGDGEKIISASSDATIKVWSLETGEPLLTIPAHLGGVLAIAVTPDGRYIASGGYESSIKIWDLNTGQLAYTLTGHNKPVGRLVALVDGQHLLSGGFDATVRLWNLAEKREIMALRGHNIAVTALAVRQDGVLAVSGSGATAIMPAFVNESDINLKIWDLTSETHSSRGHSDSITQLVALPDGGRAVSASQDGTLKVWDVRTGAELQTLRGHTDIVSGVVALPDARRVISMSKDQTLRVWDVEKGQEVMLLRGHSDQIQHVTVTPDGRYAISSAGLYYKTYDTSLKIWDLSTGAEILSLYGESERVLETLVLPDNERALSVVTSTSSEMESFQTVIRLWDIRTGATLRELPGHARFINAMALLPDPDLLLTAAQDNTLKLWRLSSGAEIFTFTGHSEQVAALAIAPDGSYAVSAAADALIKAWDLTHGRELFTLAGHSITAVGVALLGRYAASISYDHSLKIWDLKTRQWVTSFIADGSLEALAVAPDGRTLLVGGQTGQVHVLRLEGI